MSESYFGGCVVCNDCNRTYGDRFGFSDLVVSNHIWELISPTQDSGGLLCPSCMCARAYAMGIRSYAVFKSGPFSWHSEGLSSLGLPFLIMLLILLVIFQFVTAAWFMAGVVVTLVGYPICHRGKL